MKFLFDVFPVILFFLSFKWGESHPETARQYAEQFLSGLTSGGVAAPDLAPIMLATALTVLASLAQIIYLLVKRQKIDAMLWVSVITILVFGGATIYFHSEIFIKWKPTVLYWCYGGALALSQFVFGKNLIEAAMGTQMKMPAPIWARLGIAWIGFFISMGLINLWVAFNFSTDTWANFKLASMIAIMPAFVVIQSLFLSKYIEDDN